MHELVESLALSSKALLRYQEDLLAAATAASSGGRARGPGGKGRGRVASGGGKAGGLRKGFSAGGNAGAGNGEKEKSWKECRNMELGGCELIEELLGEGRDAHLKHSFQCCS